MSKTNHRRSPGKKPIELLAKQDFPLEVSQYSIMRNGVLRVKPWQMMCKEDPKATGRVRISHFADKRIESHVHETLHGGHRTTAKAVKGAKHHLNSRQRFHEKAVLKRLKDLPEEDE